MTAPSEIVNLTFEIAFDLIIIVNFTEINIKN